MTENGMIGRALLFSLLVASCGFVDEAGQNATLNKVCGTWVVSKVLPTNKVQAKPLAGLVGETLVYSAREMKVADRVIAQRPTFVERTLTEKELWTAFVIRSSELRLPPGDATIIDVRTATSEDIYEVGTFLIVRNRTTLITMWSGVFYELVRTGQPCK